MSDIKLGLELKNISHLISRQFDLVTRKQLELTLPQMQIIKFINKSEVDVFQKDIEKKFEIMRSTVSLTLSNMEKKHLIKRVSVDGDARLKKIVLTKKSLEIYDSVNSTIDNFEEILCAGITTQELQTLIAVFEKIRNNLDGGADIGRKQEGNI